MRLQSSHTDTIVPKNTGTHSPLDKTLLYIEDNPENLHLIQQVIEYYTSYGMICVHDAPSGLNLAGDRHPDLILMDINLPGMDGYETNEQLYGNSLIRDIPVVAISANATPKEIERGNSVAFQEYITKPLNVKNLLNGVDKILN